MMSLTKRMARRDVTGFLVTTGILFFVIGMILLWTLFGSWPPAILASGVGGLLYVVSGLYWQPLSIFAYRAWNRVANRVASFVRWWVSSIAFHVVVRVVGQASGSKSPNARHETRSFWEQRGTLTADSYVGQYNRAYRGGGRGGRWVGDYWRWCLGSGNGWLIFLLPFLLVLRIASGERESEVPENVYTLY
jgi:hypothetical protein